MYRVSGNYFKAYVVEIIDIELIYPATWFAPDEQTAHADEVEERTVAWMRDLGLLPSAAQERVVRGMCPRFYGGCSGSMLSFDAALLYTRYLTMWLLWDDEVVERSATEAALERDFAAMGGAGGISPSDPPYVRAWREIGDGLQGACGSLALRRRWVRSMRDYAREAIAETAIRADPAADQRPFREALTMRTLTIGAAPAIIYLEACCGVELPESVTATDDYRTFSDSAAVLQALQNDLASLPKDSRKAEIATNMVLRRQRDAGCSILDACHEIVRIHDEAIGGFDHAAARLVQAYPGLRPQLERYFDYVRFMETGFGFYHVRADRYTREALVADGRLYRPVLMRRESERVAATRGRRDVGASS